MPFSGACLLLPWPCPDSHAVDADLEVYPGEEIRVVDQGLVDNGDVDGLFAGAGDRPGRRQREFGFAGTALTGGDAAATACCAHRRSVSRYAFGITLHVRWLVGHVTAAPGTSHRFHDVYSPDHSAFTDKLQRLMTAAAASQAEPL